MSADSSSSASSSSNSSSWRALLKSIASFRGDLSSLTAPPFILSPVSQLEYARYWYPGKELFEAPDSGSTPEERFLLVVKWAIAILKPQYTQRNVTEGYEKKPLNPFLGELFLAHLDDDAYVRAEQVSHHPPISAFKINSKVSNVECEGFVNIKARFYTTVYVEQTGHTVYRLPNHNEEYIVSLPMLHVEGLVTGAPFLELDGAITIVSTTGYEAKLNLSGAGYFTGKKHSLKGSVFSPEDPKTPIYSIKGQWYKQLVLVNEKAKAAAISEAKAQNPKVKLDSKFDEQFETVYLTEDIAKLPEVSVLPVEEQHPHESRRAWQKVSDAIKASDNDKIWEEKTAIENHQRELRKREHEEGSEWIRRWFDLIDPESPQGMVDSYVMLTENPVPFWRFNEKKYSEDEEFKGRI